MSLARFYNTDYKDEDIEFYREQERKLHHLARLIQNNGFSPELYIPLGGWKYQEDDERKKLPYPNQLYAAYRLFYHLYCLQKTIAYLSADFQGGKTGVQQCFVRLTMTNSDKLRNRYSTFPITSMSDTSLLNQMKTRLIKEFDSQIYHLPTLPKLEAEIDKIVSQYGYAKNLTFIDDESRVASCKHNLKGKLMNKIKETSPFETWNERNIRWIGIDATDPASSLNASKMKEEGYSCNISLQLPPSYLSLHKLKETNRLHQCKELKYKNNVIEFYNEIQELYNNINLWHLIRLPTGKGYDIVKNNIQEIFVNHDLISWDNKNKCYLNNSIYIQKDKSEDINKLLCEPPNKPTIILIKEMYRAGKTLNDKFVGALYDRKSEKDDTTGQSFPGRAVGHNRSNITHIWSDLKSIDRLINDWKMLINRDEEVIDTNSTTTIPLALNKKMPNIQTFRDLTSNTVIIQTTGNEITRPENLQNIEIVNRPTRLRSEHMCQTEPFDTRSDAMNRLNEIFGQTFRSVTNPIDGGYYISSRLLGWYKKKYNDINTCADFQKKHILTTEEFNNITITFGCSSTDKGQVYLLYPVYLNKNSSPNDVKWYIRYAKKEFTRYRDN